VTAPPGGASRRGVLPVHAGSSAFAHEIRVLRHGPVGRKPPAARPSRPAVQQVLHQANAPGEVCAARTIGEVLLQRRLFCGRQATGAVVHQRFERSVSVSHGSAIRIACGPFPAPVAARGHAAAPALGYLITHPDNYALLPREARKRCCARARRVEAIGTKRYSTCAELSFLFAAIMEGSDKRPVLIRWGDLAGGESGERVREFVGREHTLWRVPRCASPFGAARRASRRDAAIGRHAVRDRGAIMTRLTACLPEAGSRGLPGSSRFGRS
jgi:hypothetical protein